MRTAIPRRRSRRASLRRATVPRFNPHSHSHAPYCNRRCGQRAPSSTLAASPPLRNRRRRMRGRSLGRNRATCPPSAPPDATLRRPAETRRLRWWRRRHHHGRWCSTRTPSPRQKWRMRRRLRQTAPRAPAGTGRTRAIGGRGGRSASATRCRRCAPNAAPRQACRLGTKACLVRFRLPVLGCIGTNKFGFIIPTCTAALAVRAASWVIGDTALTESEVGFLGYVRTERRWRLGHSPPPPTTHLLPRHWAPSERWKNGGIQRR